jgi:hypothetical protein
MKRIPLIDGDEMDAVQCRRYYSNGRSGIVKAIKKKYNKRFRKAVKFELLKEINEIQQPLKG